VKLKNIGLSERNQTQKATICDPISMKGQNRQTMETGSTSVAVSNLKGQGGKQRAKVLGDRKAESTVVIVQL
jgi:hypothetical protein